MILFSCDYLYSFVYIISDWMENTNEPGECCVCGWHLAGSRWVRGSNQLRHTGRAVAGAVKELVGCEAQLSWVCFRWYQLVLSLDHHTHTSYRGKDWLYWGYIAIERRQRNRPVIHWEGRLDVMVEVIVLMVKKLSMTQTSTRILPLTMTVTTEGKGPSKGCVKQTAKCYHIHYNVFMTMSTIEIMAKTAYQINQLLVQKDVLNPTLYNITPRRLSLAP